MVRIQCSVLEQVRRNPTLFGQMLASNGALKKGGTHGMLAYWQDNAIKVHKEELTVSQALKELQRAFLGFEDNVKNQAKQEFLLQAFVTYNNKIEKLGFELFDTKRQMRMPINTLGVLTGLTPWIVKDADHFYAYYITENKFDWSSELRFPLLQKYLNETHAIIPSNKLSVGVYSVKQGEFEFASYSSLKVKGFYSEVVDIFQKVDSAYRVAVKR